MSAIDINTAMSVILSDILFFSLDVKIFRLYYLVFHSSVFMENISCIKINP